MAKVGEIFRVAGPVVTAVGISPRMYDVALVGEERLMGEVIKISGDKVVIQVYEDTSGLRPGEKVEDTGQPLLAELGPGLLGSVYDGVQRPLPVLVTAMGDFIKRGVSAPGLDRKKKWKFTPVVKNGDRVVPGQVIGKVPEGYIEHRIMVPPSMEGVVDQVKEGEFVIEDTVCTVGGKGVQMLQKWPVRGGRPFIRKIPPEVPLITGQRILDTLFPLAKGGTGSIPGGFGTGKTVTQQQLAKWSDSEIVVYIGCGERGNEMTEVLATFPKLEDPKTGEPLMGRTVLISTSSMLPVAAREDSVYSGLSIAVYYRDLGHDVSLMADS
ncbi:MAG: V-type ATP synthase subunit A, partial [Methanomassiliicoccales archaeon]|nr:V-type ATP synthase subunit A [Methanomassiliicoccales archaeon]